MSDKVGTIDVSQNPLLKNFTSYTNGIEKLDFSNNPKLEELYVMEENLDTLDITKCTALKTFHLYRCAFSKLDLSTNTALEELRVDPPITLTGVKEGLEVQKQ